MTKEYRELLSSLHVFTDLFAPLWFWKLDTQFTVVGSDCQHEQLFTSLILSGRSRQAIEAHMAVSDRPVCLTVSSMISWLTVFGLEDGKISSLYLVGPFFTGRNDADTYGEFLAPLELSAEAEAVLREDLSKLPVLDSEFLSMLAVALHYCVRQEKVTMSDVAYYALEFGRKKPQKQIEADQFEKSSGRWALEQQLLERIRQGDLSASAVLTDQAKRMPISAFGSLENLASARQNLHQLLTLVSRAAADGGLPQRTAFSLCTEYRTRIERSGSVAELEKVSNELITDYARRVHSMKRSAQCSSQIRLCCEYIDTHPGEKLSLELIADKAGYSTYHLCRKFRR